jgi:hypothetical protein
MNELLDHLNQVSVFGRSTLALVVILGLDLAFTLLHTLQEWKGSEVPLWRYFGAIVGLWIPDWLGFPSFTVGLTATLWLAGFIGIAGWLPILGPVALPVAVSALGILIGARLADTLVPHVLLHSLGYRPNPGLSSTPLYVLEAIFIAVTFQKGLSLHPMAAWVGFAGAVLFFCLVLPLLWSLRLVVSPWRRERWRRGEPLPAWAKD